MTLADQTYAEKNKGKTRRYRITRSNMTLTRNERINGLVVPVVYGRPNPDHPDRRDVIELTQAGAAALSHFGLEALDRERITVKEG